MSTFLEIADQFEKELKSDASILAQFSLLPTRSKKWVWIQDDKKIIGDADAHYELNAINDSTVVLDVHFEGPTVSARDRFYDQIGNTLPKKLNWIKWQSAHSIRYGNGFDKNAPDLILQLKTALQDFDSLIGDTVRKIKTRPFIMTYKEIEIEYPETFPKYGQFQKDFIRDLGIPSGIKRVNVEFNGKSYQDLTLGQEGAGLGRIYFPNKGIEFINNNPQLKGGEKILIRVGWDEPTAVSDAPRAQTSSGRTKPAPLNTILYGPPGTGKTYNTINKAVKIATPQFDFNGKTRDDIRKEYERLVAKGNIEFCTFHQSLSYEDFIEGIKPIVVGDNGPIQYKVLPGMFKRLATRAAYVPDVQTKVFSITDAEYAKAQFYKMSLGDSKDAEDDAIFQYCIDNGFIALGWGDDINFTGKSERDITQMANNKEIDRFEGIAVNYFIHYIKPGDYVMISRGNSVLRAIGKVTGNYEYRPDSPIRYHQFRKVEWILKDKDIPVSELYNKNFSQQTIYQLDKKQVKRDFFVKGASATIPTPQTPENFVLIIDEINRGNVSAIFGELITLLEEDKRKGNKEALVVKLPYSGDDFTVPNNLYIIGTMNTADRSVEALDTALRRRFTFEELSCDHGLLCDDSKMEDVVYKRQVAANPFASNDGDLIVNGINVRLLLVNINKRLRALLSDDHIIGHAWLMGVKDEAALKAAFKDKIVPLLQEYFYNDVSKIALVLGSSFVQKEEFDPESDFATITDDEDLLDSYERKSIYKLVPASSWTAASFISVYQKPAQNG